MERFRADSAERLARLRPTDTLKGLYLARYLQMFDELGGAPLVKRGLEVLEERRIFPFLNYPYARMVNLGVAVADELVPRFGGVDAWLEQMGSLATSGYLRSSLGRAFLASFQPSPRALLKGMPWAISTTMSFGQREVVFGDATHCTFRCRREFSAAQSNAGAVRTAIETVGAKDVRIDIRMFDLFNYDLEVSWREQPW